MSNIKPNNESNKELRFELLEFLHKYDLTQRALSDKMGVHEVSVHYWLSGRNGMCKKHRERLKAVIEELKNQR